MVLQQQRLDAVANHLANADTNGDNDLRAGAHRVDSQTGAGIVQASLMDFLT